MPDRFISLDEIKAIPADQYPMLCFAYSLAGLFAKAVAAKTKGYYGHFMWLLAPDLFASQWFWFRTFPVDHFAGCNLKLVYNPSWSVAEKETLKRAIREDLDKPWYKTRYDCRAVLGILVGLPGFQNPKWRMCSETAEYLYLVDPDYDLYVPTPTDVNLWTKARGDRYKVYGRYMPD